MHDISARCQNHRDNIRRQNLQEIFAKQRKNIVQYNSSISQQTTQYASIDHINRLLAKLDEKRNLDQIYISIGNYLIDHPEHASYFEPYIFPFEENFPKQQSWVATIMLLTGEIAQLQQFDKSLAIILNKKDAQTLRYGLACFNYLLNKLQPNTNSLSLIKNSLNSLKKLLEEDCSEIRRILQAQNKYEEQILSNLFGIIDTLIDYPEIIQYLAFGSILYLFITKLTSLRTHTIELFRKICRLCCQPRKLINEGLIKQLHFLCQVSVIKNKILIVQSMNILICQLSLRDISKLLYLGLNSCIIEGCKPFQKGSYDQQLLFQALKLFRNLMRKIEESEQNVMARNVLMDLERRGFHTEIQDIFQIRHSKQTQGILTQIVDEYFASQAQL